ncbi:MAG: ThuA domain-containing protein [Vicinamibacteraceae bacterium]
MKRVVSLLLLVAVGATLAAQAPTTPARPPHVVFVTGDDEDRSEISMPMIAAILEKRHGLRTSVAYAKPTPQTKDHIEGLEALATADLMVMFLRYRALPDAELNQILTYVKTGKPIVGFRTSTHAFNYPAGSSHTDLNDGFGLDAWGQKWITHHGHTSTTTVALRAEAASHPILRGVTPFAAKSWLYHVAPLSGPATLLLDGTAVNSERTQTFDQFPPLQPVAWTRDHNGARVFFTTLGHPGDFEQPSMRRLTVNAILWALGREVPAQGADATPVTPYVAPESFDLSKFK